MHGPIPCHGREKMVTPKCVYSYKVLSLFLPFSIHSNLPSPHPLSTHPYSSTHRPPVNTMPRSVAFSGALKRQQLKEKRARQSAVREEKLNRGMCVACIKFVIRLTHPE